MCNYGVFCELYSKFECVTHSNDVATVVAVGFVCVAVSVEQFNLVVAVDAVTRSDGETYFFKIESSGQIVVKLNCGKRLERTFLAYGVFTLQALPQFVFVAARYPFVVFACRAVGAEFWHTFAHSVCELIALAQRQVDVAYFQLYAGRQISAVSFDAVRRHVIAFVSPVGELSLVDVCIAGVSFELTVFVFGFHTD